MVAQGQRFAVHARPNGLAHWRLGLVMASRHARRAVERNLYKRTWREAFRQAWPEVRLREVTDAVPDTGGTIGGLPGYDVVVRLLPVARSGGSTGKGRAAGQGGIQSKAQGKSQGRGKGKMVVTRRPVARLRQSCRAEVQSLIGQMRVRLARTAESKV